MLAITISRRFNGMVAPKKNQDKAAKHRKKSVPNVVETLKQWMTVFLSGRNGSSSCMVSGKNVVSTSPNANVISPQFPLPHRLFIAVTTAFSSRTKLQNPNQVSFSVYPRTKSPLHHSKRRISVGWICQISTEQTVCLTGKYKSIASPYCRTPNAANKKTSPAWRTRLGEIFESSELTGSVALRFSLSHHENQELPTVHRGWACQACCSS